MNALAFLEALTVVLAVAAVTTVVFQRLHQPVVLGYILAGFIVGPNVPIPLVADREIIQTLSELGVILLMFSLGLEFSLGKLFKLGSSPVLIALLQASLMMWLGFVAGRFFGWTTVESLFAGALIAVSSTTIIAKVFDEQNIRGPVRELVVGVLIVQDLIAILLMAGLTAVGSGAGVSVTELGMEAGKLALFLVTLVVVGLLVVPHTVRAIQRLGRPETTIVASIGFCFAVSLLAHELGYSVALGAFIAGSLIAESGEQHEIEILVRPLRDIFGAIFFVSVGVLIDPQLITQHWLPILVFTGMVIVGNVAGVSLGSFLTGHSVRMSVQSGMSLAQIGEFSFIIAALGLSLGATRDFLYPIAVAVSAITTLTTPWLIRASVPVANFFDRNMPSRLQTFVSLYGSWVEQFRSKETLHTKGARIRRLVSYLALDAFLLVLVIVGHALGLDRLADFVERTLHIEHGPARLIVLTLAFLVALPLAAGIVRVSQLLGIAIAEDALPAVREGAVDLAAAPRRSLLVTLQLTIVLLTGLPILAVTQPIIGGVYVPIVFALLLVGLGIAFWRGAGDLQGHARAGAQAIVEALLAQARIKEPIESPSTNRAFEQVRTLLPGLGEPTPVQLLPESPAVGKSLAALNLRGITGATVLAITRGGHGLLVPTADEVLRAGDVLALAGSHDAVTAAKSLLTQEVSADPEATPQDPN